MKTYTITIIEELRGYSFEVKRRGFKATYTGTLGCESVARAAAVDHLLEGGLVEDLYEGESIKIVQKIKRR